MKSFTASLRVSIRRADFLLFEPESRGPEEPTGTEFQSAVRIFCFSNGSYAKVSPPAAMFQSAVRIFCFSNIWVTHTRSLATTVSIRRADFLLFELHRGPP